MKIQNVNYHDKRDTFAVSFDDGITIILDESLNYKSMLSVGLGSSFLKTGKWPTKASIDKRIVRGRVWIEKNRSRYKKYKK